MPYQLLQPDSRSLASPYSPQLENLELTKRKISKHHAMRDAVFNRLFLNRT